MPRDARIAPQISVFEVAPEECVRGFRTVKVSTLDDPNLWRSFRSHYEEGSKPRYRETQHAALHMAVSFWRTRETAIRLAENFFPKHGEHVAQVVLTFGHGFDYLDPAMELDPEHLTVWGGAARLAAAAVDIVPVRP